MGITKDLSKGIIFRDDAESEPPIGWGTSKLLGYMMFTYGSQQFGKIESNGGGGMLVSEGFEGAPKPRSGTKCYRFRIVKRTDYPPCCEWTRAELYWGGNNEYTGAEWFAQSIFIPNDWVHDNRRLAMSFDFKYLDAQGPASLHLFIDYNSNSGQHEWQINRQYRGTNTEEKFIGAVKKGVWNDFVFHRNFKNDSSGFIEVFLNKQKLYSYNGPNYQMDNGDKTEGYVLFGPYKWQYATPDGQGEGSGSYNGPITAYFDEIRIGNKDATLETMSPEGSVAAPIPPIVTTPPIPTQPPTASSAPVFTTAIADVTTDKATHELKAFAKHTTLSGFIRSFSIAQVSGPNQAKITSKNQIGYIPTEITFAFENLVNGVYEFKVTATDDKGATATDNFKITKKPVEVPDTTNYYVSSVESTENIVVNGVAKNVKSLIISWKDGTKTELYKK